MSQEIMSVLTSIQVKLAKIEATVVNLKESIDHHRKAVKDHIDKDEISFNAASLAIKEVDEKHDRKHNFLLRIILPAVGGVSVIAFLLNWIKP